MTPTIHTIQTAWRHIATHTLATASLDEFAACRHDPQVRAAEAQLDRVAQGGDVAATQHACQSWNASFRRALQRQRQQGAA
jgi:hypothetical protein